MRFSEGFRIAHPKGTEWFDPLLDQDTPLYVDPFLVFDDKEKHWAGARQEVIDFFDTAALLVEKANGHTRSPAYNKALRLLKFPEPNEFALGVSLGKPQGAGTGVDFAVSMAEVLELAHKYGHVADLASIQGFNLFADGIGLDRMSDILCNILKHRFIEYTQDVAKLLGVSMEPVKVEHPTWDKKNARWTDSNSVMLPKSPVTSQGVLLVPERFLKEMPSITRDGFWAWAENNEGALLRHDFNYVVATGLNTTERRVLARKFARKHPDKAAAYIRIIDGKPHLPYDVEKDPKGLVSWREVGTAAGHQMDIAAELPATEEDFTGFVDLLAQKFQHAVENTDLWKALWALDRPQREVIVQAIAGAMWTEACRAADVDLSQEVNRGRGPVDFKFSKGWEKRALLEIKLIHNSKFFQGAAKQLPQYLKTEQINYGVYLCIGHHDTDFRTERLKNVRETISALARQKGITIKMVLVDARKNKTSASKLKDGVS